MIMHHIKKIESYKRVNGPQEYRDENVKGPNDVQQRVWDDRQ